MKIAGTGSAIPKKVVTNAMLSEFLDTGDEWILPRTGIKSRHVISDENLEDLGAQAAKNALENANLTVDDIDFFVCSNVVSEYITPGMSSIISAKIGLSCPCIDINCACPGFIYAMDIVETYYQAGKIKNALVLCAEEPSRMTSWSDRSTCILFGDGAAAVVLTPGDNIKAIKLHSHPDPSKIWEKRKLCDTPYVTKEEETVPLTMNGKEVFKFAVKTCTQDVADILKSLNIEKKDVSYYMVHQANMRIINSIKNFMEDDDSKFPTNITDHGNSSSASCPILLDECNRKGMFKKGDILVFSSFGAGLLSGVAVVEW